MVRALPALLVLACACGGPAAAVEPARVAPSGARSHVLAIELRSQLGAFSVESFVVHLDGAIVAEGQAPPAADDEARPAGIALPACVHRTLVQAGTHDLAVALVLRGAGYGVFSYLRDYRFTVRGDTSVDVSPRDAGRAVIAIAYESGGVTTPIEDRPHVRFEVEPLSEAYGGCRPE